MEIDRKLTQWTVTFQETGVFFLMAIKIVDLPIYPLKIVDLPIKNGISSGWWLSHSSEK